MKFDIVYKQAEIASIPFTHVLKFYIFVLINSACLILDCLRV